MGGTFGDIICYNTHMNQQKTIIIDGIELTFTVKRIKHLRITVKDGRAVISAPVFMPQRQAEEFARKKIEWIKKHLEHSAPQEEEQMMDGGILSLWGRQYILRSSIGRNKCSYDENYICLQTKDGAPETKKKLIKKFYRKELLKKGEEFLLYWEEITGLKSTEFSVRDMKTRWGSCNIKAKRIWLSLRLARYDEKCASYVVLHELLHLAEKGHNKRFYALLCHYCPDWRQAKKTLERQAGEKS